MPYTAATPLPSLILDHLGDAIITTTQDFTVTSWNRAATEIYGWEAGEAIGQPAGQLLQTVWRDAAARDGAMAELHSTGCWGAEVVQTHRNGQPLNIHAEVRLLRDPDGRPVGAVAVNRDITARRQAESALVSVEAHLAEVHRGEALGRLAGSVAHDFNNLLAVIQGQADLSLLALPPGHAARAGLEKINAGIERAAMLTRQLLSFGRRDTLDVETLDLVASVRGVDEVLRCLVGGAHRLVFELPPGPTYVQASCAEVEQVLLNLCSNARDALVRSGTVTVRVQVPGPGVVELSVADTGGGMSEEVLAHAFEAFYTTKAAGRASGLGLAVVARIAHRLGGAVSITSTLGSGTCVTLRLPATEPVSATPVPAQHLPLRVLVCEDQDLVREVLTALLNSLGHHTIVAADGEMALALAREEAYDLLLTDVSMPRMSGPELAEALRGERPQLPVIYVSGFPAGEAPNRWPAGVWRQKPLTRAALRTALEEAVGWAARQSPDWRRVGSGNRM